MLTSASWLMTKKGGRAPGHRGAAGIVPGAAPGGIACLSGGGLLPAGRRDAGVRRERPVTAPGGRGYRRALQSGAGRDLRFQRPGDSGDAGSMARAAGAGPRAECGGVGAAQVARVVGGPAAAARRGRSAGLRKDRGPRDLRGRLTIAAGSSAISWQGLSSRLGPVPCAVVPGLAASFWAQAEGSAPRRLHITSYISIACGRTTKQLILGIQARGAALRVYPSFGSIRPNSRATRVRCYESRPKNRVKKP